jgi:hypothetical protein
MSRPYPMLLPPILLVRLSSQTHRLNSTARGLVEAMTSPELLDGQAVRGRLKWQNRCSQAASISRARVLSRKISQGLASPLFTPFKLFAVETSAQFSDLD